MTGFHTALHWYKLNREENTIPSWFLDGERKHYCKTFLGGGRGLKKSSNSKLKTLASNSNTNQHRYEKKNRIKENRRRITKFLRLPKCGRVYSQGSWGEQGSRNADGRHYTDMVPADQSYDFPKLINFPVLQHRFTNALSAGFPFSMEMIKLGLMRWCREMSPVTGRAIQQKYKIL